MRWYVALNPRAWLWQRNNRRAVPPRAQEPADLGTAFGMEACLALEAQWLPAPDEQEAPRRRSPDPASKLPFAASRNLP